MIAKKGNITVPVLFFIVLLLVGVLIVLRNQQTTSPPSLPPLLHLPVPTPAPQETDVHSGDGAMKLVMRSQKNPDGSSIYSFTASDISGSNSKFLLTKTVRPGGIMSIPPNSWSPDNTYVFIQKNEGGLLSIFILKASGEPFGSAQGKPDNEPYLDVGMLFTQNQTKYAMVTATGWASPTLLIITTAAADPAVKTPNYWFEIPSRAFLQLAH